MRETDQQNYFVLNNFDHILSLVGCGLPENLCRITFRS